MIDDVTRIHVLMPNDELLEVEYYCREYDDPREVNMRLIIQLDDCVCSMDIEKSICKNVSSLERLVHNKVINTKGHLC